MFLILLTFSASILFADDNLMNSPLDPAARSKYEGWLGLELGMGPNIQSGILRVPCRSCEFDNGRGTGFLAMLNYDHYFNDELSLGLGLSYEEYSFMAQYREIQSRNFTNASLDRSVLVDLELQQRAEFNYSFLGVTPFVRYRPVEWISVKAGLLAAFGEPTLIHTERVNNPVRIIQGRTYVIQQENSDGVLHDAVPEGVSSTALFGNLSVNGHLWLRYDLSLLLGAHWRQQLGAFDFYGSDFTIVAPRFTIGLEYMIYRER